MNYLIKTAHADRSRQMAAHAESGSAGEFILFTVAPCVLISSVICAT